MPIIDQWLPMGLINVLIKTARFDGTIGTAIIVD